MRKMAKKAVVLLTVLAMLVSMVPGMAVLAADANAPIVQIIPKANADGFLATETIDPSTLEVGDVFIASIEFRNIGTDVSFAGVQVGIYYDNTKLHPVDFFATEDRVEDDYCIYFDEELIYDKRNNKYGFFSAAVVDMDHNRGLINVMNAADPGATVDGMIVSDSVVAYQVAFEVLAEGDTGLQVQKKGVTPDVYDGSQGGLQYYADGSLGAKILLGGVDGTWYEGDANGVDRTPIVIGAVVTEEPTATPEPVTEAPTATPEPVTEEPTATPEPVTEVPATAAPALYAEYDLSGYYANGKNGTTSYAAPILTMTKDQTGSNFNNIIWSDSADGLTDQMTLMFDARVEGGLGHSWDGYAVSLRTDGGDYELIRLVATTDGVAVTRGAGADTKATVSGTGYHAYSVQYNKTADTIAVYADGALLFEEALGFSGTQHGFLIKSGHNDATGAVLKIADMDLWTGATVRAEATTVDPATEAPTEAPTPAPIDPINNYPVAGEQKWAQDSNTYVQDGEMYIWSDSVKALLTSGELAMISFDVETTPVVVELMKDWNNGGAREAVVTLNNTGKAIVLFVPNGDTSDYYAYIDGVLVGNGSLTFNNADVWNYNVDPAANVANAKVNTVASWLPVNEATEAPVVTPAPAKDYTDMVPVAGAGVDTWKYANNGTENANGGFDLDANGGDQASYIWSDPLVGKINEGKEVMVSFTITIPEDNAVMSAEHGVQVGYMAKNGGGDWGIYTFPEAGTFACKLGLLPDGQYYFSVDDVQVATGTLNCAYADLWTICWRTYWAGNTNTKASIANIASAEVAEWVPEAIVTEAPTEAPAAAMTVSNAQKSKSTSQPNAIFYAITVQANGNTLGTIGVSHVVGEGTPATGSLNLSGMSGVNVKVAATLAGIPEDQYDTVVKSTFTLTYGDAKTVTVEKDGSFNTAE